MNRTISRLCITFVNCYCTIDYSNILQINNFQTGFHNGQNGHPRAAGTRRRPHPDTPTPRPGTPTQIAGDPTSQTGDMSSHQVTTPSHPSHSTRPATPGSGAGRAARRGGLGLGVQSGPILPALHIHPTRRTIEHLEQHLPHRRRRLREHLVPMLAPVLPHPTRTGIGIGIGIGIDATHHRVDRIAVDEHPHVGRPVRITDPPLSSSRVYPVDYGHHDPGRVIFPGQHADPDPGPCRPSTRSHQRPAARRSPPPNRRGSGCSTAGGAGHRRRHAAPPAPDSDVGSQHRGRH